MAVGVPNPQPRVLQNIDRLFHTREVLHHCLVHPGLNVADTLANDAEAYSDTASLLEPLTVMYRSLQETGDEMVANGE